MQYDYVCPLYKQQSKYYYGIIILFTPKLASLVREVELCGQNTGLIDYEINFLVNSKVAKRFWWRRKRLIAEFGSIRCMRVAAAQ